MIGEAQLPSQQHSARGEMLANGGGDETAICMHKVPVADMSGMAVSGTCRVSEACQSLEHVSETFLDLDLTQTCQSRAIARNLCAPHLISKCKRP